MTSKATTLRVRQIKSGIGFSSKQKATLKALGLGRIGKVRHVNDTPQMRGMLFRVSHLVSVESGEASKS